MTIFGQNSGLTPFEKCQFFDFLKFLFLQPTRRLFVPEYRKRTFPGLYCLRKKKFEKWPFLDQNHALTPLEQYQVFDFLNFLFFIAQKDVFSFQNIVEKHFHAYIALKKKLEKIAIFGPKPWVNTFGKMSIFRLFEHLVLIAQKGIFSFQNILKDILKPTLPKNKVGEMAIFGPKPQVNPFLKNVYFFEFLNFLFSFPRNASFCSRIS